MRWVSGISLLFAVLAIGCGGSSMRDDRIDGVGGGGNASGSGGTSNPGGGTAGSPNCEPQDAQYIGTCVPGPEYAFTGVECVGMSGCDCLGADCEKLVPLPPGPYTMPNPCELEFGGCFGMRRSCDEIAAVYAEYTSRNACASADDCWVAYGGCSVGIGGCYHVMNRSWPPSGIDALIEEWQATGCSGPVCDCDAPPTSAVCVAGVCMGAP